MKKLVSVAEDARRRASFYAVVHDGVPNGIACPECGKELYDSDPTQELESYPPQKKIKCVHCNYEGTRLA